MQHFAGTPHETTLVAALTAGVGEGLTGELLEVQLVEGIKRYWLRASKRGETPEGAPVDLSAEETERARQRELARQRVGRSV
jgi:hypothetical protein